MIPAPVSAPNSAKRHATSDNIHATVMASIRRGSASESADLSLLPRAPEASVLMDCLSWRPRPFFFDRCFLLAIRSWRRPTGYDFDVMLLRSTLSGVLVHGNIPTSIRNHLHHVTAAPTENDHGSTERSVSFDNLGRFVAANWNAYGNADHAVAARVAVG
jgi:hypothetical protein